jgi:hypothetical protein
VTPEAPSAADLQANPVVQAAFAAAWADSLVDDAVLRHEEGGYLYSNVTTGAVIIRRVLPGERDAIRLHQPPILPDCFLVATFHTHPNPLAEGWIPEPSPEDREGAAETGMPWFVITELGVLHVGPDRRVGGLTGPGGYPL